MAQARADLDTIAARVARRYPKEEEKLSFKLTRPGLMGDCFGAPASGFLAGVLGLAGIVLLAACALGLAWVALTGLANWHPPTDYPIRFQITPQPSLIPIALLISAIAGLLFGVMPLRQIFKTNPNEAIKSGTGQSSASQSGIGRRLALRDVLLAAQNALCCVTVTAAFVSLRGLGRALSMDMGFNPKHAVLTKFELSEAGYSSEAADRFQRLPGVAVAGYANATPLSLDTSDSAVFSQQSTDFRHSNSAFDAYNYDISPGYFTAAGTPLLAGRDVSFADNSRSPAVAVVNRQFARHLFHSEDAVGRYFKNSAGLSIRIVGVVANGKYFTLTEDPEEAAFFPISQEASTKTSLVVRTGPDFSRDAANDMAATVRKAIRDLDPAIPIRQSGAWNNQLGMTFFVSRVATVALGLFGAFGLLLSTAGTFGLASYTVGKRLRELSLRVALGAQAKQILSAALGRMLILLASGAVVGIALGAATSRLLSAVVYQASAQDPFVLVAVALTMVLTGLLSVAGPVRRALHIDPATVLREQ